MSGYGENLAWVSGVSGTHLRETVALWGSEKQYFIANSIFPNVSKTGNWQDVGHYTQIIWRNTTQVGCGYAGGNDDSGYLVCQYYPAGNVVGQKVSSKPSVPAEVSNGFANIVSRQTYEAMFPHHNSLRIKPY